MRHLTEAASLWLELRFWAQETASDEGHDLRLMLLRLELLGRHPCERGYMMVRLMDVSRFQSFIRRLSL